MSWIVFVLECIIVVYDVLVAQFICNLTVIAGPATARLHNYYQCAWIFKIIMIIIIHDKKLAAANHDVITVNREVSLLCTSPCKWQNILEGKWYILWKYCYINWEINTGQTAPTQQPNFPAKKLLHNNVCWHLQGKMKLVLFCLCYTS